MQGPLPQRLQPLRGWACSPTLPPSQGWFIHPCLCYQGQFHCVAQARCRAPFSQALQPVRRQGLLSHTHTCPRAQLSLNYQRCRGVGQDITQHPPHNRPVVGPAPPHLSPWVGTPTPLPQPPKTAPVCCLFQMQGLLSRVVLLVRDGASSPEPERLRPVRSGTSSGQSLNI